VKKNKKIIIIFLIMILCLFIDQLTKFLVVKNITYGSYLEIIPNFLFFTYVSNTGAAFSILTGGQKVLILISILILILFLYYLLKLKKINNTDILIYGILLGGIFGNLLDRIRNSYVIDFINFKIKKYNFPIFNIADIFIVIAGILLIIKIIKEDDKNEV
jgi:signal peptidase II